MLFCFLIYFFSLVLYGSNRIDIGGRSYFSLLFKQMSTPIYIFQIFSICVWLFDEYVWYAGCVAIVALFSAFIGAGQSKKVKNIASYWFSRLVSVNKPKSVKRGALGKMTERNTIMMITNRAFVGGT